ncbi:MAG: ABC transporter permease, partial [Ilumatobacter fluminis]
MVGGYDSYFRASDDPSLLDEQLTVEYRAEDGTISVPYAIADDPIEFAGTGELMITADAARDAGFEVVHTGVIVRTGAPLTPSQLDDLAALQQQLYGTPLDAFIEPGDPPRSETSNRSGTLADEYVEIRYEDPRWNSSSAGDVWLARLVIVGAALGLSMLVVSIGLSLAAAEGRDERDVFAVIGARPSSMRRQAAARAAVLSLVGIGLGIPLGFVPTWVIDRVVHDGDGSVTPVSVPWPVVASLVVVIPVVAAGAAWIASGLGQRLRPPSPTRRD